jgi:16S rRNA (guanine(966)-N(2))-methyltransferase RsmD
MRVIAGKYKGRRIAVPPGRDVRPTSDKVKGAVFSMAASLVAPGAGEDALAGLRCLDLFAGTGALGIEALSRGARECVFVEIAPAAAQALEDNLRFAEGAQVMRADWRLALRRLRGPFDIVFADPPYGSGYYAEVMKMLIECDIIGTGGIVVAEYGAAGPGARGSAAGGIHGQDAYDGYALLRDKRYGKTRIAIYERTGG